MAKLHVIAIVLAIASCTYARIHSYTQRQVEPGVTTTPPRRLLGSSFAGPGNKSYEYIVVGGGNAGLPLAVRLAEGGHSVAVIEAGSFYEIGNSNFSQIPVFAPAFTGKDVASASPQVDWTFQTVPQKGLSNQTPLYTRGKTLGGCSARNFNAYLRGTKGTHERWAEEVGDDSYLWENVIPYFEKSINFTPPPNTRFHNATPKYDLSSLGDGSGPLHVTFGAYAWAFGTWAEKALAAAGVFERKGFTSGKLIGSSHQLLTLDPEEQVRDSAETSFLRRLGLKNPNLIVYPNTLATRILFNDDKRATGVDIDFGGYTYTLDATKEIIVSAGAFQSPQLLMVSGIGPKSTLNEFGIPVILDRPGVGQNLTDHVVGGPSYRISLSTSDDFSNPDFTSKATEEYNSYPPHGPYASINGDLLAFEKLPEKYLSELSSYAVESLAALPEDWPDIEHLTVSNYTGPTTEYSGPGDGHNYASIQFALAAPFSRGNITIQSADMHDHPVINPNWLVDSRDQEVAVAGYKRVREIFNMDELKPIRIGDEFYPGYDVVSEEDILEHIQTDFFTLYHASCTCRMGKDDDPNAVVNSKARVIGAKNLRVVDASSFALLPAGHPMGTIYMLAEKIADDILESND